MNPEWTDDKDSNINIYQKRYRREEYFLTTFLELDDIPPDNNAAERMNHKFASIRSDGGGCGKRTEAGMETNSIPFTVAAACAATGENFFDVLCCTSGDVWPSAANIHVLTGREAGEVAHGSCPCPQLQKASQLLTSSQKSGGQNGCARGYGSKEESQGAGRRAASQSA